MANIYYRNVKENGYPLEKVPSKWRGTVAAMLAADEAGANSEDGDPDE